MLLRKKFQTVSLPHWRVYSPWHRNTSERNASQAIDLKSWDCRDRSEGTAKTPDGVERNGLKNRPGVELAGITSYLPFSWDGSSSVIVPEGYTPVPGESIVSPNQLYVSPGTGYWGPPMRVGTQSEITSIRLRSANRMA